ncbi:hypothetical protein EMIT0P100_240010 [Pseudomonas sp. IT-P100]
MSRFPVAASLLAKADYQSSAVFASQVSSHKGFVVFLRHKKGAAPCQGDGPGNSKSVAR